MSSPNDVNVNTRFTADTTQVRNMFSQLQRLDNKLKQLSKKFTQLGNSTRALGSRMDTTSGRVTKLNKRFSNQQARQDRVRSSLQRLNQRMRGYSNEVNRADAAGRRGNKTLGFTGLAFGFVGGIAGFAADQIRNEFVRALEETASIMSEISRINIFSDVGIREGAVNLQALEKQTERVFNIARDTGIATQEVAELLKNVEKAAPANLDATQFGDIVAGMKLLENELDTTTIAADIITIQSNFEELDLDTLADQILVFGKANKLTFTASAKAFGFAAQNAKLLNTDLDELLAVTTVMANKVPGQQGNVGRALRRLTTAFQDPTTIDRLRQLGVNLVDTNGRFIGLEASVSRVANKFKEYDAINQEQGAAFLKLIGLTENARLALLAYADASEETKRTIREQFLPENVSGQFKIATEFQKTQPEAIIGRFKNQITELTALFTTGVFPALNEINDLMKEIFADKELIGVLTELGKVIGQQLVAGARVLLPLLRTFGEFLKNNTPAVHALATAITVLVGALTGLSIIFPILGLFFALIFLHEKLMARSLILGKNASFVARSYSKMFTVLRGVATGIGNLFRGLGQFIFTNLTTGLRFIGTVFAAAGARAGAFFSLAFNIVSNAFIAAGRFITNLFSRLLALFTGFGTAMGTAFGSAFTTASESIIAAGAWLGRLFTRIGAAFATAGAAMGTAFGGLFTASSETVMAAGAWLGRVFTQIGIKFAAAGTALGTAFGGLFTAAAGVVMRAGAWITNSLGVSALRSKLFATATASGTFWGAAFMGAIAAAIATLAVGLIDILQEQLFGTSVIRDIQRRLGIRQEDTLSAGDILGIPKPSGPPVFDPLNRETRGPAGELVRGKSEGILGFFEDLANFASDAETFFRDLFGIPADVAEEMPSILEENKNQYEITNVAFSKQNATLPVIHDLMNKQIEELVKNINVTSAMTTKISEVNLMFTRLIAEGDRAAGKLASLYVTDDGEFRIRDPGISAANRAKIAAAEQDLARTIANQTRLTVPQLGSGGTNQQNAITINPVINVSNTQGLNLEQLVARINEEFAKTLQKNVSSIITV